MCKSRDIKTWIRFMKNDVIGDVVTIEKRKEKGKLEEKWERKLEKEERE